MPRKSTKEKEMAINAILDNVGLSYESYDKVPESSCFMYRPDFVFDFGTHKVLLEVDEAQHLRTGYSCLCEQKRAINLVQDNGGIRTVLLRYNPDAYFSSEGRRVKSTCKKRAERLIRTVCYYQTHVPDDLVTVVYMYYDGDNDQNDVQVVDIDTLTVSFEKMTM